MTTPTYDLATPRRPNVNTDMAGAALVDEPGFVPDPTIMPSADVLNMSALLGVAHGRVVPVAILEVSAAGVVTSESYARATAPSVTPSGTLNGAGDVSVTWSAADFPPALCAPVAVVRGTSPTTIATEALSPGARVRSGAAVPFTLFVY